MKASLCFLFCIWKWSYWSDTQFQKMPGLATPMWTLSTCWAIKGPPYLCLAMSNLDGSSFSVAKLYLSLLLLSVYLVTFIIDFPVMCSLTSQCPKKNSDTELVWGTMLYKQHFNFVFVHDTVRDEIAYESTGIKCQSVPHDKWGYPSVAEKSVSWSIPNWTMFDWNPASPDSMMV